MNRFIKTLEARTDDVERNDVRVYVYSYLKSLTFFFVSVLFVKKGHKTSNDIYKKWRAFDRTFEMMLSY